MYKGVQMLQANNKKKESDQEDHDDEYEQQENPSRSWCSFQQGVGTSKCFMAKPKGKQINL